MLGLTCECPPDWDGDPLTGSCVLPPGLLSILPERLTIEMIKPSPVSTYVTLLNQGSTLLRYWFHMMQLDNTDNNGVNVNASSSSFSLLSYNTSINPTRYDQEDLEACSFSNLYFDFSSLGIAARSDYSYDFIIISNSITGNESVAISIDIKSVAFGPYSYFAIESLGIDDSTISTSDSNNDNDNGNDDDNGSGDETATTKTKIPMIEDVPLDILIELRDMENLNIYNLQSSDTTIEVVLIEADGKIGTCEGSFLSQVEYNNDIDNDDSNQDDATSASTSTPSTTILPQFSIDLSQNWKIYYQATCTASSLISGNATLNATIDGISIMNNGYPVEISCREGFSPTSDGECICDIGYYISKDINGQPICSPCPRGTYRDASIESCAECSNLYFQSTTVNVGSSSVENCVCAPDYYLHDYSTATFTQKYQSPFEMVTTQQCNPCLEGTECKKYGTTLYDFKLAKGYWRTSNISIDVLECSQPSCQGGVDTSIYCAPGYEGPLCSICQEDYAPLFGECAFCASENSILSPLFLLCFVIFLIYLLLRIVFRSYNFHSKTVERKLHNVERVDRIAEYSEIMAQTLSKLKMIFINIQITINFPFMLEIQFPSYLMQFFGFFGIVNLNFMDLFHMGCWVKSDFYSRLIVTTSMPFLIVGAGGLSVLYFKYSMEKTGDPFLTVKYEAALSVFKALSTALTYLLFPAVGSVVFQAFTCHEFDNGQSLLGKALATYLSESIYIHVYLSESTYLHLIIYLSI